MIWPWLLFDYYHPKSKKSRFVQCFQWLCNHSEKPGNLVENRITLENTAFYQLMPENSDRRHCSCQALSLCKKARRKLMHLSLRLAFARTDCTPMTHCVPMGRNNWFSGLFEPFWYSLSSRLSLAELRSATSCFETVLHETEARFCLIVRGFSSFLLFVHQFLNPRFCRLLSDFNPNLFLMCRLLCWSPHVIGQVYYTWL